MRCAIRTLLLVLSVGSLPTPARAATAAKSTAADILNRVDDLYRGKSAAGTMTMRVKTAHWQRELRIEFWSKGTEQSLMRIEAPKKEKGTATLKSGVNIWNYLPKVRRVIKVPSSMMGGSWMGSHFTNDDLVKESRMAEDFTFETSFEGTREGREVTEITCTPKPDAAVVWGRVTVEVDTATLMPRAIRYFDEDMALARTLTFGDVKTLGNRQLPVLMRAVPADKPDEYTEVRYDTIEFGVKLADSTFTLRNLKR